MASDVIQTRLAGLPAKPGVYILRDAAGRVIYVGKAVSLRSRVRSYFQEGADREPKTEQLVSLVADLEWIVTDTEVDALVLECELIKRHRPRFNIRLRDDKRYPYIKVSWQEDFPRVYIVRTMQRDGARYYGPFPHSRHVYQTLELLRRLFPYRTCEREITGRDRRPCLYYHIKRCPGPCIGAIDREAYRAGIARACLFLEGRQERVVEDLRREMAAAAEVLRFERAAQLRDQILAVSEIIEGQRIVSGRLRDHDVIALARDEIQACVQVFFVREGRLVGREYFVLSGVPNDAAAEPEALSSFLVQYYDGAAALPPEVLVQHPLEDAEVIARWLSSRRGARVRVNVPQRGVRRELMRLAAENAAETLVRLRAEWEVDTHRHVAALAELQQALDLPEPPGRIECYDISNIQGTAATGSMVVFAQGVPSKRDYRRFRIKTVEGADDAASMAEVLRRRFRRAGGERPQRGDGGENRWAIMPDLVIVDGGKPQLGAALAAMREAGVGQIPVVGLAKQNEELYVPGRAAPVVLPRGSQGLFMVQRIRDEAHRFAVSYHRRLRERQSIASTLEEVPGIGPQRRRALLERFGSLAGIRRASVEELAGVPGMTREAAERLAEHL